ncbi:hypothetical protein [Xylophilus sp. GOD-11R]|uniref:hypothetical protein n=1 Tax=Xylophilus sp. GOD-11R TaxID=3089814 RepID=UPI00298C2A15|nr:hypothetical protein [Xylophilus sp. GOD-11R]WPB56383.1 hypothetical protein R9X41_19925 [Xylophilus sp. GOD-11R]
MYTPQPIHQPSGFESVLRTRAANERRPHHGPIPLPEPTTAADQIGLPPRPLMANRVDFCAVPVEPDAQDIETRTPQERRERLDQEVCRYNRNGGSERPLLMLATGLIAKARTWEEAIERLRQISEAIHPLTGHRVRPDTTAYNAAIAVCCRQKQVAKGEKLFDEIVKADMQPDAVTYSHIILGYARTKGFHYSTAIFEYMVRHAATSDIKPDSVMYHMMIKSYLLRKDLGSAQAAVTSMWRHGVAPHVHLDAMLRSHGLRLRADDNQAPEIVDIGMGGSRHQQVA